MPGHSGVMRGRRLLLARLLRLDEVTSVRVPTLVEESARDLTRCREAARADLMRARHRLSKLLLRDGIVYCQGKAWTQAHDYWLLKQPAVLPALAGTQAAFADAYESAVLAAGRRDRLDAAIIAMAGDSEFTPVVRRLSCLRGISTLTAMCLRPPRPQAQEGGRRPRPDQRCRHGGGGRPLTRQSRRSRVTARRRPGRC